MGRVIFHSDMNSCFASIECLYDPSLRGKPVSVCGDIEARHGIVLASTPEAKRCGVRTGEAIWEAKRKCPELVTVLPHYDRYLKFSRLSREIYGEYTDLVEPFGLDEAFLDVSGCVSLSGDGKALANEIRRRVKQELGITVSIGVADNKIFAKLGSDLKKPDAVTVLPREKSRDTVWPLPVGALLGVGRSTERKLTGCGISTIGALACCGEEFLRAFLGKMGTVLHTYANGMDASPVLPIGEASVIKSISNGTTPPRDIRSPEDAGIIITMLSESVASRLRRHG
ncbi:MAG: DNA polymerase IV, partial [Oscillospiraceae bacterium]|nr:DNA polymerase IV [Oscillospiraceae bacterium]